MSLFLFHSIIELKKVIYLIQLIVGFDRTGVNVQVMQIDLKNYTSKMFTSTAFVKI